jgi:signal transduction histidine kinase
MKFLTICLTLAIASTYMLGCAKKESALDKAVDSTKDALDLREHEKLKDAAEDAHAAIKDAASDAKAAAEDAAAQMKDAAAEAKNAAKDAAQAAKDAAVEAKQTAKDAVDHK